ncbi:MAG: hypothetical protein JXA60_10090 [Candidatus Coatesbacteria bacterium]|nr:hypothetical protein [Candidatus Coatesbacteria bacterium]
MLKTVFFILFVFVGFSYSISIYFDKDDIQVPGTFKWEWMRVVELDASDRPTGEAKDYWSGGGRLKGTGKFIKGQEEGLWTYYHRNGQKEKEGYFKNGKPEGKWTFWHTNGKIDRVGMFKNGFYEGIWLFYYESGIKKAEGQFIEGDPVRGTWKFWNSFGTPEDFIY